MLMLQAPKQATAMNGQAMRSEKFCSRAISIALCHGESLSFCRDLRVVTPTITGLEAFVLGSLSHFWIKSPGERLAATIYQTVLIVFVFHIARKILACTCRYIRRSHGRPKELLRADLA